MAGVYKLENEGGGSARFYASFRSLRAQESFERALLKCSFATDCKKYDREGEVLAWYIPPRVMRPTGVPRTLRENFPGFKEKFIPYIEAALETDSSILWFIFVHFSVDNTCYVSPVSGHLGLTEDAVQDIAQNIVENNASSGVLCTVVRKTVTGVKFLPVD